MPRERAAERTLGPTQGVDHRWRLPARQRGRCRRDQRAFHPKQLQRRDAGRARVSESAKSGRGGGGEAARQWRTVHALHDFVEPGARGHRAPIILVTSGDSQARAAALIRTGLWVAFELGFPRIPAEHAEPRGAPASFFAYGRLFSPSAGPGMSRHGLGSAFEGGHDLCALERTWAGRGRRCSRIWTSVPYDL